MPGGRFARPVRRGAEVERAASGEPVHALLRHFERIGFALAPRYLGTTANGRDRLDFLPGAAAHYPLDPTYRSAEAMVAAVRAVREMHDATVSFLPAAPASGWRYRETCVPARIDCIGHHDLAPWNLLFDGARVTGIIDWDVAAPSNRVWDLSYLAHRFVPLSSARLTRAFGWSTEPDRAARLRLIADTYGHDVTPAALVDACLVRLGGIAAHIEERVRVGDPAYRVHRDERHADGYREDMHFLLTHRDQLG